MSNALDPSRPATGTASKSISPHPSSYLQVDEELKKTHVERNTPHTLQDRSH